MPLIILTGYPCSGLTHRANQLAALLDTTQSTLFEAGVLPASKPRYKIHVVPTHDYSHPRTVYDNARTEKETRGVAYARAKRLLGRDSFVILDGMNYIKGYRYQLWCEAKALGTTCCVVHVGTPIDQCVANNEARLHRQQSNPKSTPDASSTPEEQTPEHQQQQQPPTNPEEPQPSPKDNDVEDAYPPELLNNLIFRYEEPSTHSRWDKPLFTVPWEDDSPPVADIWSALTGLPASATTDEATPNTTTTTPLINPLTASLAASHLTDTTSIATGTTTTRAGSSSLRRTQIKPHQATVQPPTTDSSALYSMEKRTSTIVSAIRSFTLAHPSAEAALAQSPTATGITIPVPEASTPVFIPAHVATSGSTDELAAAGGILTLPRLQRLRRQWISLNRSYVAASHAGNQGSLAAHQVPDAFVRFLNADFAGEGAP